MGQFDDNFVRYEFIVVINGINDLVLPDAGEQTYGKKLQGKQRQKTTHGSRPLLLKFADRSADLEYHQRPTRMKGDQKNGCGFAFNKSVWATLKDVAGEFVCASDR